jgi:hypothetical protein
VSNLQHGLLDARARKEQGGTKGDLRPVFRFSRRTEQNSSQYRLIISYRDPDTDHLDGDVHDLSGGKDFGDSQPHPD